ncbi:hypothetical protein Tco_0173933 [Tanacetum coccineum]
MAHSENNTLSSAFKTFFERETLTGPNFNDWYRSLRIVLRVADTFNYLYKPCPGQPVILQLRLKKQHSKQKEYKKQLSCGLYYALEKSVTSSSKADLGEAGIHSWELSYLEIHISAVLYHGSPNNDLRKLEGCGVRLVTDEKKASLTKELERVRACACVFCDLRPGNAIKMISSLRRVYVYVVKRSSRPGIAKSTTPFCNACATQSENMAASEAAMEFDWIRKLLESGVILQ